MFSFVSALANLITKILPFILMRKAGADAAVKKGLKKVANYILSHHEHYDGSGYPKGLSGDKIPLLNRIMSVADSFDAMTNDRVYKKAMSKEEAFLELKNCSGSQFDPKIVDLFISEISEI